jgi:prepilin-type N-terminal cleavage/methylation domain-containing protein
MCSAFTLLEVLVATAVLALMMTFLFNLLGSSAKLWEIGNKKIEAAQAARVGLNIIAKDLKNAFAGNMTSYTTTGGNITNIAPFIAIDTPNNAIDFPDNADAENTNGSHQIFGVFLSGDSSEPFKEFGFLCVFLKSTQGTDPMIGRRYYLVRKSDHITKDNKPDFYLRAPSSDWATETSVDFLPIIDNCIRLTFEYYGDQDQGDYSNPTYSPKWTKSWNPENPTDRLPLGVLVTISVLDSKTAEKIAAINAGTPLTDLQISNGLSSSPPATLSDVERLISQGSVTMSRFIPFNSN